MNACPCGCLKPVKPGNTYGSPGCAGRMAFKAIPREVRSARAKQYCASLTPQQRHERSSKGGRNSDVQRWAALLEKWQTLCPREALRAAYKRGYLSGWDAGTRRRKRREEAA